MILYQEAGAETRQDLTMARLIVLIVPIIATASVFRMWLSPPFSWGISTFGWMLICYWFPSKPRVSYLKWIFLSLLFAVATSLLAAVL